MEYLKETRPPQCFSVPLSSAMMVRRICAFRGRFTITMLNKFRMGMASAGRAAAHVGLLEEIEDGAYDALGRAVRRAAAVVRAAYAPEG